MRKMEILSVEQSVSGLVDADFRSVSLFGSSSADRMGEAFKDVVSGFGSNGIAEGRFSERFEQTGARLGSHPWRLCFPDSIIPASGSVQVTALGKPYGCSRVKPFHGTVHGVHGKVKWDTAIRSLVFYRTEDGDAVSYSDPGVFVPDISPIVRRCPMVLWLAKNNMVEEIPPNTAEYAAQIHKEVVNWLSPDVKRVIVIGHFRNMGMARDSKYGARIDRCNEMLSDMFGDSFIDIVKWMTSDETWERLSLRKTSDDIEQLSRFNMPPSLASGKGKDKIHLSGSAYRDIAYNLLRPRMRQLGWF